jgi:hypothetical protein
MGVRETADWQVAEPREQQEVVWGNTVGEGGGVEAPFEPLPAK